MTLTFEIPDKIVQSMRIPPQRRKQEILIELALTLYAQGILSLGKARELAGVEKRAFLETLGKRKIPRHYDHDDLEEDIAYARGE